MVSTMAQLTFEVIVEYLQEENRKSFYLVEINHKIYPLALSMMNKYKEGKEHPIVYLTMGIGKLLCDEKLFVSIDGNVFSLEKNEKFLSFTKEMKSRYP